MICRSPASDPWWRTPRDNAKRSAWMACAERTQCPRRGTKPFPSPSGGWRHRLISCKPSGLLRWCKPRRDQEAYDIRASDIDRDRDLDLLIAGRASNNVAWPNRCGRAGGSPDISLVKLAGGASHRNQIGTNAFSALEGRCTGARVEEGGHGQATPLISLRSRESLPKPPPPNRAGRTRR